MKLDRAKRTSKPKTNLSAAHAKQPNTTEPRAQTNQNRNAKKLPIPLLSDALKKDETGPCQAQPAKTIRRKKSRKKSLTLRSDALQKDDERPAQQPDNALQAAAAHAKQPNTTESRAQTNQNRNAKKLPIPLLSDALKKDETGPCQAQPAKTIRRKKSRKKSLTLRSDALQKDDERPAQQPDNALQAAAEPGQKYGSMAASPYRKMKKGQRRPHGVGPKDPKHGFFGALPLRQRGRRIFGRFGESYGDLNSSHIVNHTEIWTSGYSAQNSSIARAEIISQLGGKALGFDLESGNT